MSVEKGEFILKTKFYASFGNVCKTQIKQELENNGWLSRKSGWSDFELTNDWSELSLEGEEEEPLLNGVVVFNKTNVEVLNKTFIGLGGRCAYEFYDENKNLLFEKKEKGW